MSEWRLKNVELQPDLAQYGDKEYNSDNCGGELQDRKKENIIPLACSECGLPVGFVNGSHTGNYTSFKCRACTIDLAMLGEILKLDFYPSVQELYTSMDNIGCELHDSYVTISQRVGHSLVHAWYQREKQRQNEK